MRFIGLAGVLLYFAPAQEPLDVEVQRLVLEDPAPEESGDAVRHRSIEVHAGIEGRLLLAAESQELDPLLVVLDESGVELARDADGGGGTTAWIALDVVPERRLEVRLAAEQPGGAGAATLTIHRLPESAATRAAALDARRALEQARKALADGEHAAARSRLAEALEAVVNAPGVESSVALADLREEVGLELFAAGDAAAALEALEGTRAFRERTLPATHADLLAARSNVATLRMLLGDAAGARPDLEAVVAAHERAGRGEEEAAHLARLSLADACLRLGDLESARDLQGRVVASWSRTLPPDDERLLEARNNLAVTLTERGELHAARDVLERVVAQAAAGGGAGGRSHDAARINLARVMRALHDFPASRALLEQVLVELEARRPADDADLQAARVHLGITLLLLDEPEAARELFEQVVAVREATLPADHPDLLDARIDLAIALAETGEVARARSLREEVAAVRERTYGPDHPRVLADRLNLADSLAREGDLRGARVEVEDVLRRAQDLLPYDDPSRQLCHERLAWICAGLGDAEGRAHHAAELARSLSAWLQGCLTLAPREARERADAASAQIATLVSLGADDPRMAFELVETVRALSTGALDPLRGGAAGGAEDEHLRSLRARALEARRLVHLRALGVAADGIDPEQAVDLLAGAVRDRDRLEAELQRALVETGRSAGRVGLQELAAALPEGSVAVGYRVFDRYSVVPGAPIDVEPEQALIAHVVSSDGSLERVELAAVAEVSAVVAAWRAGVGDARVPEIAAERGLPVERVATPAGFDPTGAGKRLRELVLDPVLEAAGEVETLVVCADGALHLVPLDALPLEDGVVGDRSGIRLEVSFARLTAPAPPPSERSGMLVVGGVDFDAGPERGPGARASRAADPFSALPATGVEAREVGELFEARFDRPASLLLGDEATKETFLERAPDARFLHLATHGWFRSPPSPIPDRRGGWSPQAAQEALRRLAPGALCGLALAGANRGLDEAARAPGVITAEEIAGIDLGGCELAVLSACETSAGEARQGLALQSLQAALHAAGARTALTSLWRVSDEAASELMGEFYRQLWEEGRPKAEALWQAKCTLRERGRAPADWAGWLLTGDPR